MMYDEFAFERFHDRAERAYLSGCMDEPEERRCCTPFCYNEAEEYIEGDWYCSECAEAIRREMEEEELMYDVRHVEDRRKHYADQRY